MTPERRAAAHPTLAREASVLALTPGHASRRSSSRESLAHLGSNSVERVVFLPVTAHAVGLVGGRPSPIAEHHLDILASPNGMLLPIRRLRA